MKNLNEVETSAIALPLPERAQLIAALDASIAAEQKTLADQALAEDLRIVNERFALLDAGKMPMIDGMEAMERLFGSRGVSR